MNKIISESEQREIEKILNENKDKKGYYQFFEYLFNDAYKFSLNALVEDNERFEISVYEYLSYVLIKNRKLKGLDNNKIEKFKEAIFNTFDCENIIIEVDKQKLDELFELANTVKLPDNMINKIYEILIEKTMINEKLKLAIDPANELSDRKSDSINYDLENFKKKYNLKYATRINILYEADDKNIFDKEVDISYQSEVTNLRNIFEKNIESKNIYSDSFIKAIELWLEQNPGKTINDINLNDKIKYFGKEIHIGSWLRTLKNHKNLMSNEKIEKLKKLFNFDPEKERKITTDEEWIQAIDKWLELNPNKTINDINKSEWSLISDKPVHLGMKIFRIKSGQSLLSEKYMKLLYEKYGFSTLNEKRGLKK